MSHQVNALAVAREETTRRKIAARLESLGTTVQAAPDCLTAMGIVKTGAVDLVILADAPGEFDAIDMTRVLKSLRTEQYLPVLVVAQQMPAAERRQAYMEAGVDEILPPDFDAETLQGRCQAAMRLKSAFDQLRQVKGELAKTTARENTLLAQLREDNRNLKVRSITDGLTALYNYRYLMEWLKTEFKISRRYGHELSMVIADLDFFKRINDEHGHPCGDFALKEVAVILKRCARESDLVARYAGDEFALVCPRTGSKEVQALARRILTACRTHDFHYKEKAVPVAISLGTATYPEDAEITSPEMLVFLADQAMYQSKRKGRSTITSWHDIDPDTRQAIRRELRGPEIPLLADDPKSRLELAAAAHLVDAAAEPTSLCLEQHDHSDGLCSAKPAAQDEDEPQA